MILAQILMSLFGIVVIWTALFNSGGSIKKVVVTFCKFLIFAIAVIHIVTTPGIGFVQIVIVSGSVTAAAMGVRILANFWKVDNSPMFYKDRRRKKKKNKFSETVE